MYARMMENLLILYFLTILYVLSQHAHSMYDVPKPMHSKDGSNRQISSIFYLPRHSDSVLNRGIMAYSNPRPRIYFSYNNSKKKMGADSNCHECNESKHSDAPVQPPTHEESKWNYHEQGYNWELPLPKKRHCATKPHYPDVTISSTRAPYPSKPPFPVHPDDPMNHYLGETPDDLFPDSPGTSTVDPIPTTTTTTTSDIVDTNQPDDSNELDDPNKPEGPSNTDDEDKEDSVDEEKEDSVDEEKEDLDDEDKEYPDDEGNEDPESNPPGVYLESGSGGNRRTITASEHTMPIEMKDCYRQSPINIESLLVKDAHHSKDVTVDYITDLDHYTVTNNGHTIQIEALGSRSIGHILVDGVKYEAKQFHFHAPSEHTFDAMLGLMGRSPSKMTDYDENAKKRAALDYDSQFRRRSLEMHIVHSTNDPSDGLVVFAITFEVTPGAHNAFLKTISSIPHFPPPETRIITPVKDGPLPSINLPELIGGVEMEGRFVTYRYNGSLTTPPLTEGVKWVVMRDPVEAGIGELFKLRQALIHEGTKGNYRMLQNTFMVQNNPGPVERVIGRNYLHPVPNNPVPNT